jgi:S1-C subfamily serine protease
MSPGKIYKDYSDSIVFIGNYDAKSVGTGSLIHKNGLIVSNWHVIDKAEVVGIWIKPKGGMIDEVTMLNDIEPYMGTIVETDKKRDLAIIKVAGLPNNMKVLELGNLSDVGVADNVYAIGHPGGLPWSFTLGIVSQIRPNYKWSYDDKTKHEATLIQTQTPISPGNSGGPLFSEDGKLVGINTSKSGGENLNFAVSVEHVKELLKANPGLDKINPGSAQMKKDYPNARTWDENKNGVTDTWYVDTNNSGKIDTAFLDDDEDGFIEALLIDKNENEVWEILVVDSDLDGNPDLAYMDDNEDGKPDVIAYDYNQDGEWDKFEKIS